MNKIAVDCSTLSDQYSKRGIGNYAFSLISELIQNQKYEWHLIGYDDLKDKLSSKACTFHSIGSLKLSTPRNIFEFRSAYLPVIEKINPDLYFAPHFEKGLPIGRCNVCVAIHDISPLLNGKYSNKSVLHNFLKGVFYRYNLSKARKADAIIANSNFTKSELAKIGIEEGKINVTHLSLPKHFNAGIIESTTDKAEVLKKYNITKPYILYYGGFEPNKNVESLLKVFSEIRKKKDIYLVIRDQNLIKENGEIIVKSVEAQKALDLMKLLKIEKSVIITDFIEWEDLPIINSQAEAFVHLSQYEGFGLAVLEALGSGAPVVAANRSSYPEVIGDSGILVDPTNIREITGVILNLLDNEELKKELSRKGRERVKVFSWRKCAQETIKVFDQILKDGNKR